MNIRDKIAASKARGMWMGGVAPVGYRIEHRQLVINEDEVELAQQIFDRYLTLGSVRALKEELDRKGIKSPKRKSLTGKSYGGCCFSRGKLYWVLKNPAYIGKISHKGKIHEGLHEAIIPIDTWERVQLKLKDQTVIRTKQTKRRFMLQGLVYDSDGILYGPTYTSRHDRQYCYYVSQNIKQNRDHPSNIMARLPGHALEATIEKALRQEIPRLSNEEDGPVLEHLLQHHENMPAYDLVRTCVEKVTIGLNQLTIRVKTSGFQDLAKKHLNVTAESRDEVFEVTAPFKVGKAKRGAIVIEPGGPKDIFDLPPHKLKKLIQGFIWRDEHFAGMLLKEIAHRENYSAGYVNKAIFSTFEIGQKSFPVTV